MRKTLKYVPLLFSFLSGPLFTNDFLGIEEERKGIFLQVFPCFSSLVNLFLSPRRILLVSYGSDLQVGGRELSRICSSGENLPSERREEERPNVKKRLAFVWESSWVLVFGSASAAFLCCKCK